MIIKSFPLIQSNTFSFVSIIVVSTIVLGLKCNFVISLSSCSGGQNQKPKVLNLSKNICMELCTKSQTYTCLPSGACVCEREPTPTSLGGEFVHCTNWDYVDQKPCKALCQPTGKNDTRTCWTIAHGNYCTCF